MHKENTIPVFLLITILTFEHQVCMDTVVQRALTIENKKSKTNINNREKF